MSASAACMYMHVNFYAGGGRFQGFVYIKAFVVIDVDAFFFMKLNKPVNGVFSNCN